MGDRRILTNRQWYINGNWFSPQKFLCDNFVSVVYCDYMETTSSAGDWTGLIIQHLNGKLYVTIFSQENTRSGFNLITNDSPSIVLQKVLDGVNYQKLFEEFVTMICN